MIFLVENLENIFCLIIFLKKIINYGDTSKKIDFGDFPTSQLHFIIGMREEIFSMLLQWSIFLNALFGGGWGRVSKWSLKMNRQYIIVVVMKKPVMCQIRRFSLYFIIWLIEGRHIA